MEIDVEFEQKEKETAAVWIRLKNPSIRIQSPLPPSADEEKKGEEDKKNEYQKRRGKNRLSRQQWVLV